MTSERTESIGSDPLWYKNAVIYEIPIRAFCDSNADGIGDIQGVISKLDYLCELGVTAVWLLPFYPSPLRDGGYDIADYSSVHPMYGSLADFKRLLKEAHERGIRVITELVINHTSKDHPWFERARRSPKGSKWRDFYVWSDTNTLYRDARIIFRDFESSNWTWDTVAEAFYWHRFYSHQPDLNFENPEVHKAVLKALDFWLDMGVDGLRLDAIPYLYERDGTNCENLPETHQFLKKLRKHVDSKYSDRMLLAEANQWPADAAAYFGEGDECHMNFHFPLMPRMFMAVQLEDQFPIVDILRQTPTIPENCQWATFLRNHDELTLEMVTDEDRDYMYRVYARDPSARLNLGIRRRLAPLLGTRQKVELMNGLLFSLPGTPVLYYGDEIGMGDNIYLGDRDGVRTPMQWSADRNAGFSQANPQKLFLPVIADPEYRHEAVNVQAQQNNPSSLLWWMKRTIALRKRYAALRSGGLKILQTENPKILAFLRLHDRENVLVVANLSRFHQFVDLELMEFEGDTPVEMTGVVRFPRIGNSPYRLTLAPYGFLWFLLEPSETLVSERTPRVLQVSHSWVDLWKTGARSAFERLLLSWVTERRWFRAKSLHVSRGKIIDAFLLDSSGSHALLVYEVEFSEGVSQRYVLPLTVVMGEQVAETEQRFPHAVVTHLSGLSQPAVVMDSVATARGAEVLLTLFGSRGALKSAGSLTGMAHQELRRLKSQPLPAPKATQFEQTNSTLLFGDKLLLKVYRQIEEGPHSELEIGMFLNNVRPPAPVPKVLGGLSYRGPNSDADAVIGLVQEFVPNQGTAWEMAQTAVGGFFDRALSQSEAAPQRRNVASRVERLTQEPSAMAWEWIGSFLPAMRVLGKRTAEVHLALGSATEPKEFAPAPFDVMHQQSIYQWTRALVVRTFQSLRKRLRTLPEEVQKDVARLLEREETIERLLQRVTKTKIKAQRIRCHGDLHLGQVLHTGDDFFLIDFEGEPARPINERSYKRCPLRDVTGMIRSFNYATEAALRSGRYRDRDREQLTAWARYWEDQVSAEYLRGYLETAKGAPFLPSDSRHIDLLLNFYEIEKAVYEIGYEMNNRPDWLSIPVSGLLELAEQEQEQEHG